MIFWTSFLNVLYDELYLHHPNTPPPPPPLLHAMDHNNTDIEGGEENFTVSKKNLTMI